MNHASAEELRDTLSEKLEKGGFQSYPKLVHLKSDDAYEVRIVLHPDEEVLKEKLSGQKFVPWEDPSSQGTEYVKRTPRTPSQNTDDYGFYPSQARRHHDGPSRSPDVNPAYPGLRRIPELQDLVRRVAMREDLKLRLARVNRTIGHLSRLSRIARAGHGYRNESEHLVLELLAQLQEDGHTGRHKIVRLTKKLQNALKADGYSFAKG
jgi:hypothetical protein